jgi:hypothetical protein
MSDRRSERRPAAATSAAILALKSLRAFDYWNRTTAFRVCLHPPTVDLAARPVGGRYKDSRDRWNRRESMNVVIGAREDGGGARRGLPVRSFRRCAHDGRAPISGRPQVDRESGQGVKAWL